MNQTVLLAIAIPFALASYVPLFRSAITVGFMQRLVDREARTRAQLVDGAIDQLKDLRVKLDEFFSLYDHGHDPFMREARPGDVMQPVREYVRLISLQDRMVSSLSLALRLSKVTFYFLLVFAILMTLAVVSAGLSDLIGVFWGNAVIAVAGIVFIVGGAIFIAILVLARRVDSAHVAARQIEAASDGSAFGREIEDDGE